MLLGLIASGGFTLPVFAQESGQERAINLRAQLAEVQAKQAELQMRLQQLAEDIKPENIEHAFAGIGSTHPEDLREQRRRQLEIEKKGVESQLDTLAASGARLESAIASADAIKYQSAGLGGPSIGQTENNSPVVKNSPPVKKTVNHLRRRKTKKHRRH
jgi:septal ring factor EnvC (AmiA/AmiB activator)